MIFGQVEREKRGEKNLLPYVRNGRSHNLVPCINDTQPSKKKVNLCQVYPMGKYLSVVVEVPEAA